MLAARRSALRLWGALPSERLKTEFLARLGPRFLVTVWALVFDQRGRVLLFEHTHDRAHPWGLPSGRLESRETPEDAVRREFREEVLGEVNPRHLVAAVRDFPLPALRLAYSCELLSAPRQPSAEISAWGFFTAGDLPVSLRPLQRDLITALAPVATTTQEVSI